MRARSTILKLNFLVNIMMVILRMLYLLLIMLEQLMVEVMKQEHVVALHEHLMIMLRNKDC